MVQTLKYSIDNSIFELKFDVIRTKMDISSKFGFAQKAKSNFIYSDSASTSEM